LLDNISTQFGDSGDDIDLADIGRALGRRWWIIAYFGAAGALVALLIILFAKPQFSLNGSLYFGDSQSPNLATAGSAPNPLTDFQNLNSVPTAVALIQSRALLEQAILETGLNVRATPAGQGQMSYWRWRFEDHNDIDAYAPQPGDLTILFATLFDPGSGGGVFTLTFGTNGAYQMWPKGRDGRPILSGALDKPAAGGGMTLLVKLAAGGPPPAAGSRYSVMITPAKSLAESLIGGKLKVIQGGQPSDPTQTADIKLSWDNPYQGQVFLNQLMKDFIATQLSWKTESASDTQQFVGQQLDHVESSLSDADGKLAAYQAQTGILDVPANAQAVVAQLSQYEVQRSTAQLQQLALQQLVASTSQPQRGLNPYLVTQAGDAVLAQLAGTLATDEVQLRAQSLQYTGSSPELQTLEVTVQQTQEAIRTLLQNDEALAAGRVADLDNLIAKYQAQLKLMPAQSRQITELTRASDVFGQLYVLLMQDEEEAEVSKAATIVNTRVVSQAEVPLSATSPKGSITLLTGLILGLLLGMMIVLASRVLSGRFHSEGDVKRSVNLPIYGMVPRRPVVDLVDRQTSRRTAGSFPEAFRLLRARIERVFSPACDGSKVILISSVAAGEGKTTISINLAKSFADDGKRVLVVDGDLHRGHLYSTLQLQQSPGLSELLSGTAGPNPQAVVGQRYAALSAGAYVADPADLLKDAAIAAAFNQLRHNFDYIIVDCPPLPSVVDTLNFGTIADLILSVVYLERTSRAAFSAHNDALRTVTSPRGIIVNGLMGGPHYQKRAYADIGRDAAGWRLWRWR